MANTNRGCPCKGAGRTCGSECSCGSTAKPCRNKVSNITCLRSWKLNLKGTTYFFASFCPCFVVMQVSKYKNGGCVWVRDIGKHMFTQSHWSLWSKCIWRVSSTFGVYNCYISYRLSLFFDLDFVGELYSHKQQQYFPLYEFHYHFTTASLQVSLYSFALNSLVETQDAIQFRATEGPSLIKLKAGKVKRKKEWGKTMM